MDWLGRRIASRIIFGVIIAIAAMTINGVNYVRFALFPDPTPRPYLSPTPDYRATVEFLQTTPQGASVTSNASFPVTPTSSAPAWVKDFDDITDRSMYVCVAKANVRDGPGTTYRVVKQLTNEWSVMVYGRVGEWFYTGFGDNSVTTFMHQSVLCDQPRAVTTSVPTAEPTASTWCGERNCPPIYAPARESDGTGEKRQPGPTPIKIDTSQYRVP